MPDSERPDLFYRLTDGGVCVFFRRASEVKSTLPLLADVESAVMEVDGSRIHQREDLYRLSANAMRYPKEYYGDEEYAPNADAFLEYFDDVAEWIPAKGHVLLIRNSEDFLANSPDIAGHLVELIQVAHKEGSTMRVVFVLQASHA